LSLDDLTEIGFYLVVILYFFLPVFVICFRGRIIWAGIALFVIQFLPVGWQIGFTDSEAPGAAFLLLGTFPYSVAVFLMGVVELIVRRLQSRTRV
jgi:hypothetical protein